MMKAPVAGAETLVMLIIWVGRLGRILSSTYQGVSRINA